MNTTDQTKLTSEQTKNVITTSLAGASLGLLYAYGFDFNIIIGLLAGLFFGAAVGFRINRKPLRMRYPMFLFRRTIMAATFMLLTSFGYSYLLDQDINQTQRLWAGALPLLGWAAVVISIGTASASLDELQRRIQTEAIAIAFAGTAIFVGGYALFQFAGLPEVNVGLVLFVMSAAWLIGKLWTLWRYK